MSVLWCVVETSVAHNSDRASLVTDYTQRTHLLSKEVQHLKRSKQHEVDFLILLLLLTLSAVYEDIIHRPVVLKLPKQSHIKPTQITR